MLKWAIGKDDRPTKSLRKRLKQGDMQRDAQVGLICKHRNNLQGPSRILHKSRVRVDAGVINNNNNHQCLNNLSDNGKVNGHNYKVPDQSSSSSLSSTSTDSSDLQQQHHHNNNNNNITNADSKSLLYMSLDHLPMAIVKQYERMLQDAPKPPPKSALKSQHVTNCANSNNHPNRPLNSKTKNPKQVSPQHKKSFSKSITFKDDVNEEQFTKTKGKPLKTSEVRKPCPTPILKASEISIKEAHNRPLKALSSTLSTPNVKSTSSKVKSDTNKTPSPEIFNEKYPHNIIYSTCNSESNTSNKRKPEILQEIEKCPELPLKKQHAFVLAGDKQKNPSRKPDPINSNPSLTYSKPNSSIKVSETKRLTKIPENNENDPHNGHINNRIQNHNQLPKSTNTCTLEKPVPARLPNPHDTTDPQFLEMPITYSTPPVSKCAKKLTLKRSELKKLERLKVQTEKLNFFLKKYYHLTNLEEEDQCSPEEKPLSFLGESDILESCYENVHKHQYRNRFPYSNPRVNNKFHPIHASTLSYSHLPELSVDDYSVTWENLLNTSPSLISYSNETTCTGLLPIIQEDSGEVSSSTGNSECHKTLSREKEIGRDTRLDESYLMSRTRIETDDSLLLLTKDSLGLSEQQHRDRMSDNFNTNVKISYEDDGDGGEEEGGFGMKKLKALIMLEPLGDAFDPPASLAEDEGFIAYSPASTSSTSTFNRFSVSSSSGKGSTGEHENLGDDCSNEELNLGSSSEADQVTSEEGGGPKYMMELKHENANYLPAAEEKKSCNHNETWNSHGYMPNSPCGNISLNSHHSSTANSSPISGADETLNKRENDHGEESFMCNRLALAFSTPVPRSKSLLQTSLRGLRLKSKKSTPRKVVRKPPVNSAFSGKGELFIRTYKNDGDFISVHVLQARRLEAHSQSSWKLSIKVSLLPEPETTLTRSSEATLVGKNRTWVKIDQKFSFEVPSSFNNNTKIFLTAVKRNGKKSSFLGWTTLALSTTEKTQCWLKLRKRMSAATYPTKPCPSNSTFTSKESQIALENRSNSMDSPSPQPVHTDGSSTSSKCDCDIEPKSQLQNSSTMDSGVEDCCEPLPPLPPPPSIDMDAGQKISVKMVKTELDKGFGFSVVWVSPARIERLERGKPADLAGLRIGDLIIGVNKEDVSHAPNTTIYTKMKSSGIALELEVWRTSPPIQSRNHQQTPSFVTPSSDIHPPSSKHSNAALPVANTNRLKSNVNECRPSRETTPAPQPPCAACLPSQPQASKSSTTNANLNCNQNPNKNLNLSTMSTTSTPPTQTQPPPPSILKPFPARLAKEVNSNLPPTQIDPPQRQSGSENWKIRFNLELLDNEEDCLKQFFICELKFFRKVVAGLDRYLIPAQSNHLLTPQEINLIFSNVIKIITVTKRILNCVANGSSTPGWKLGDVLCSTHSDHMPEIEVAYTTYAKTLGCAAMILSEKMSLQEFAKFVLETPVPKGHLDMTSLLFAPLEHLRNICEICEAIGHNSDKWLNIFNRLKGLYADIVCETDFMEPISHVSMKKNPLLSVRDLEKRVVSTSCQPVKVCEKGRHWIFGSRLYKKESDGSWTPVWAFLFTDIIVLTSHTTRDRVFFVKEPPIRLEDVVTLHFNLPKKHENEFRLLFEPEPVHQSRLDKLLPIHRNKKSNQIALRAPNIQLKSIWKLLLQRQIITLNTRLSKSASSNFSISEFCERFPITPQCEDEEHLVPPEKKRPVSYPISTNSASLSKPSVPQNPIISDEKNLSVIKEEKANVETKPIPQPRQQYAPDGLSSLSKELIKNRITPVTRATKGKTVEVLSEEIKVTEKPTNDPSDTVVTNRDKVDSPKSTTAKTSFSKVPKGDNITTTTSNLTLKQASNDSFKLETNNTIPVLGEKLNANTPIASTSKSGIAIKTAVNNNNSNSSSPINNNNNEVRDFNQRKSTATVVVAEKCPCVIVPEKVVANENVLNRHSTSRENCNAFPNAEKTEKEVAATNYPSFSPKQPATSVKTTAVEQVKALNPPRNVGSPKIDSPRPVSRQEERLQQKNVVNLSSPSPSPSMSNNRVEALKYEGVGMSVGMMKSKPGSKIMTNATLKSRQQELLAQKEGQTVITMVEKPSTNSANDTDCILISQHIEPTVVVTTKDASSSPLLNAPRCHSENGFVKTKSVHTDSPILTGYGSEKSRRRVLYDYKVQRDYPELFGISPKDRRSYIKHLAEKKPENDKSFVAPYYFSPLPTPKFIKKLDGKQTLTTSCIEAEKKSVVYGGNHSSSVYPIIKTIVNVPTKAENTDNNKSKLVGELKTRLQTKVVNSDKAEEPENDAVMNLKKIARGMLGMEHSDEDTDEDSDEIQAQVHRQRSPEESSNDSGISDEVTDKSKLAANFQSTMAVNSSEVKFSTKLSHTIIKHCDKMQLLPKNAHACNPTPMQSTKIDHVYFEGEEKRVAPVVVLKADASTETDDGLFHFHPHNNPEKSMRVLMTERREAFFASYQSSSHNVPYHHKPIPEHDSPLKVKIVDGNILQTTKRSPKPVSKSPPSERVQLTRFPEKEKSARVERVESSDDSTSSDLASASPAAENGTTEPSWSSSSSSLAGYASSKEEPSTTTSTTTSIYNSQGHGQSCPKNKYQVASTSSLSKVFMSDFTNGLSLTNSTNFCNFSNRSVSLGNNGPEIVVTQESPETPTFRNNTCSSEGEDDESVLCNGRKEHRHGSDSSKKGFPRMGSNDSTVENVGDDDDYNFDDEEELSQCSIATINRYGTFESLEKIETEDSLGGLPDFSRTMTRSKARFTFEDDDSDDDNDLFEEDFESDFNFRFPSQIQDNTYNVSRLGNLPPLLEEEFEDDIFDEQRAGSSASFDQPTSSSMVNGSTLRSRHETGLRNDNGFLLARLATMYARSSISPLKILRDLWLKKRYRQPEDWKYKE